MLVQGDRAPVQQAFQWTLPVDGTSVDHVQVVVKDKTGALRVWVISAVTVTGPVVDGVYTLDATGADLPVDGRYQYRAFFYDASDNLVYVGGIETLDVDPCPVPYPEDV